MINKNQYKINSNKKLLRKVGKNWKVISVSLLLAVAGGATVTAHANASQVQNANQPSMTAVQTSSASQPKPSSASPVSSGSAKSTSSSAISSVSQSGSVMNSSSDIGSRAENHPVQAQPKLHIGLGETEQPQAQPKYQSIDNNAFSNMFLNEQRNKQLNDLDQITPADQGDQKTQIVLSYHTPWTKNEKYLPVPQISQATLNDLNNQNIGVLPLFNPGHSNGWEFDGEGKMDGYNLLTNLNNKQVGAIPTPLAPQVNLVGYIFTAPKNTPFYNDFTKYFDFPVLDGYKYDDDLITGSEIVVGTKGTPKNGKIIGHNKAYPEMQFPDNVKPSSDSSVETSTLGTIRLRYEPQISTLTFYDKQTGKDVKTLKSDSGSSNDIDMEFYNTYTHISVPQGYTATQADLMNLARQVWNTPKMSGSLSAWPSGFAYGHDFRMPIERINQPKPQPKPTPKPQPKPEKPQSTILVQYVDRDTNNIVSEAMPTTKPVGTPFDINGYFDSLPNGYVYGGIHGYTDSYTKDNQFVNILVDKDSNKEVPLPKRMPKVAPESTILVNYIDKANGNVVDESLPVTKPVGSSFGMDAYLDNIPSGYVYDGVHGYTDMFGKNNQFVNILVDKDTNKEVPLPRPAHKVAPSSTILVGYVDRNTGDVIDEALPVTKPVGTSFDMNAYLSNIPSGYVYGGIHGYTDTFKKGDQFVSVLVDKDANKEVPLPSSANHRPASKASSATSKASSASAKPSSKATKPSSHANTRPSSKSSAKPSSASKSVAPSSKASQKPSSASRASSQSAKTSSKAVEPSSHAGSASSKATTPSSKSNRPSSKSSSAVKPSSKASQPSSASSKPNSKTTSSKANQPSSASARPSSTSTATSSESVAPSSSAEPSKASSVAPSSEATSASSVAPSSMASKASSTASSSSTSSSARSARPSSANEKNRAQSIVDSIFSDLDSTSKASSSADRPKSASQTSYAESAVAEPHETKSALNVQSSTEKPVSAKAVPKKNGKKLPQTDGRANDNEVASALFAIGALISGFGLCDDRKRN